MKSPNETPEPRTALEVLYGQIKRNNSLKEDLAGKIQLAQLRSTKHPAYAEVVSSYQSAYDCALRVGRVLQAIRKDLLNS